MSNQKVLLDSSVWIQLAKDIEQAEFIDESCRRLGLEVLVCTTVLNELTGCHLKANYRAINIQTLSTIKHTYVEDAFLILNETPLGMGELVSDEDAKIYDDYLPYKDVQKRRDLVIAKTAVKHDAQMIWNNSHDESKLRYAGIDKSAVIRLSEFLVQLRDLNLSFTEKTSR